MIWTICIVGGILIFRSYNLFLKPQQTSNTFSMLQSPPLLMEAPPSLKLLQNYIKLYVWDAGYHISQGEIVNVWRLSRTRGTFISISHASSTQTVIATSLFQRHPCPAIYCTNSHWCVPATSNDVQAGCGATSPCCQDTIELSSSWCGRLQCTIHDEVWQLWIHAFHGCLDHRSSVGWHIMEIEVGAVGGV